MKATTCLRPSRLMPSRSAIAALVAVLALSACAPKVAPPIVTPRPTRPPVATPSPTPAKVVTEPYFANYLDAPETPGNWSYAQFPFGTQAIYNSGDPATSFALSCVAADRRITFTRPLAAPQAQAFEIVTESVSRSLSAVPAQGGAPALVATLDPSDDILDAMAITKGRFAVQTSGARTLYIPAWVEVSRVIEDCR